MEQGRFDAIARALGAGLSRRAGLRAAAAAAIAAVAGRAVIVEEAAASKASDTGKAGKARSADKRSAASEKRPCGPKASDNLCKKHGDCCTKYCKKGKGGKASRCRCVKRGKKCKNGQTCCGGATCVNKRCTPRCTVCASGCAYTTVNAAYAAAAPGAVITIGSGTYPTEVLVTKDITLQACGGATDVVLTPTRTTQTPDSYYVVIGEDQADTTTKHAVTLDGLRFAGTAVTGIDDEVMIYSYTNGTVSWTVRGCTLTGGIGGLYALNGTQVIEDSTFTGCSYGLYFAMDDPAALATVTGSTLTNNLASGLVSEGGVTQITGCTVSGNAYGGIGLENGVMTITDTSVTGNSDQQWGGGVWAWADEANSTITFAGTTLVTGNTAPDASGFGIDEENSYTVTVIGVSSSNVYGNTVGDQCERSTDGVSFTPVANCAF
ncbi:MAG: right-handed parallel beta-helix repeat-containing protein [Chloroflexota bacterium]